MEESIEDFFGVSLVEKWPAGVLGGVLLLFAGLFLPKYDDHDLSHLSLLPTRTSQDGFNEYLCDNVGRFGLLFIGWLVLWGICQGVECLVDLLPKAWRLIVSFIYDSRRAIQDGVWKCQQKYLGHPRAVSFIGTSLRKTLTAAAYTWMLTTQTPRPVYKPEPEMFRLFWPYVFDKGDCYRSPSVGQGFYAILTIWFAVIASADFMAHLERRFLGTRYRSAKLWSIESIILLVLAIYFWPVPLGTGCERNIVETNVLILLFLCFLGVYAFTYKSWPSLGVVDFFRSCITITKQSWRRLRSVSDTPHSSIKNISQCVHEHDTDPDKGPLVFSTCKSICCGQCFNACRDSDQRVYCPQHLALGPQQLHPLRSSHGECCMCNGDDGLLDTPCGHPVCTTCVTRVARGRVQAFGRNRVNGRVTRISETDYHCECCFPLGPDPSPPTVADLLASRLNDHRPSLIH